MAMFTKLRLTMLRRTVYLYISHIVTFSQERRVKCEFHRDRRYQQRSSIMYNFSYPSQGVRCGVPRTYRRASCSNLSGSCPRRSHRRIATRRHSGSPEARIRRFCTLIRSSDRIPAACLSLRLRSGVACTFNASCVGGISESWQPVGVHS